MAALFYRPNALAAFLDSRQAWAFGYGRAPATHDCARFADAGVCAVTGDRPLRRFTGKWSSERGARLVLARHGGMAAAIGQVMDPVAPTLARRGDVALIAGDALALVEGDQIVGLGSVCGLVRMPRSAMIQAWTVRP
jgi:hypothetical protein